jgi:hypothetical protein
LRIHARLIPSESSIATKVSQKIQLHTRLEFPMR